jgi:hypothetical protein
MTAMLRRLIAVALVAGGVALPMCAQRGDGARGGGSVGHSGGFSGHGGGFAGHSGGFSGGSYSMHSAPAYRSSFAPAGRTSFMGAPQYRRGYATAGRTSVMGAPQFGGNRSGNRTGDVSGGAQAAFRGGPVRNGPGYGGRQPVYGTDRYRRPYLPAYGAGFGYGASGWWDMNDPGYFDSDLYDSLNDDSGYDNPGNAAPAATPADAAPYYPGGYGPQPMEQAQAGPYSDYRPVYQSPQPEPAPENAVTLVFKDGRPTEEIHNYLLTRTTLYVQGERLREIAVADLDLAATEKVNREAGVDFRLPDGGR